MVHVIIISLILNLLIQMKIDKSDLDLYLMKLDKILVTISKNQLFVL